MLWQNTFKQLCCCKRCLFAAYSPSYGSNYYCNKTASYTLGGRSLDYCYIKSTDGSLTWSQGQGACLSLNYTSLAIADTPNTAQMIYDNIYTLSLVNCTSVVLLFMHSIKQNTCHCRTLKKARFCQANSCWSTNIEKILNKPIAVCH